MKDKWLKLLSVLILVLPVGVIAIGLTLYYRQKRSPSADREAGLDHSTQEEREAYVRTVLSFPDVRLRLEGVPDGASCTCSPGVTTSRTTDASGRKKTTVSVEMRASWVLYDDGKHSFLDLKCVRAGEGVDHWLVACANGLKEAGTALPIHEGDIIQYSGKRLLIYADDKRRAFLLPDSEVESRHRRPRP